MLSMIISSLFAFIFPGLLMVSVYRNFLINLNFLVFITLLLICFVFWGRHIGLPLLVISYAYPLASW